MPKTLTRKQYLAEMADLLYRLDVRHFTALELCDVGRKHPTGAILFAPARDQFLHMIPTIVRLEQVRRTLGFPMRINSGFRSTAYNRAVGGSSGSMHLAFNAVDIVPLGGGTLDAVFDALLGFPDAKAAFGIQKYPGRGFVHFDTRGVINPGTPAWIGTTS